MSQRIRSSVSKRTDAQRHRQSGVQVDADKVEAHILEDKVLAFIRNDTSGAAPMDIENNAPGQTQAPSPGSSNQSTRRAHTVSGTVTQT